MRDHDIEVSVKLDRDLCDLDYESILVSWTLKAQKHTSGRGIVVTINKHHHSIKLQPVLSSLPSRHSHR